MIDFNMPTLAGKEQKYVSNAIEAMRNNSRGYTGKCEDWFVAKFHCDCVLFTPSCTAALEMAALLIDTNPGDEIIMPSFTFASSANAFVLRGAKIVFVDVNPETMNIDEGLIEAAVTKKTKAILIVHYAGVSCEMSKISEIVQRHNLYLIEDAAQALMSYFQEKPLGTFGHLSAISFHQTKNYTSGGEGGVLLVNDEKFAERARVIQEKGTNRSKFLAGQTDKYTWVDIGGSFIFSELQAAFLYSQLEKADDINLIRQGLWDQYFNGLKSLEEQGLCQLPKVPDHCKHNAHIFFLKLKTRVQRDCFIDFMRSMEIQTPFHYVPLHSSPAGKKFGRFNGRDEFTSSHSQRLVRLPIYHEMSFSTQQRVVTEIFNFYNSGPASLE